MEEQGPPPGYPPPTYAVVNPGNGTAIGSLICGMVAWIACPFVGAVLAVLLGISSVSEARRYRQPDNPMAIAGVVLGMVQLSHRDRHLGRPLRHRSHRGQPLTSLRCL